MGAVHRLVAGHAAKAEGRDFEPSVLAPHRPAFLPVNAALWSRAAAAGTAAYPAKLDTGHGCPFPRWLSSGSSGSHEDRERENDVPLKSSHDTRGGDREENELAINRFRWLLQLERSCLYKST